MHHDDDPPSDTLAALSRLDLLRHSPRADLVRLTRDADLIDLPPGDVIDVAGSRARQFVGIVDGCVQAVSADGGWHVLGPGAHFGAAELLGGYPHDRSYVTATATRIVLVFGPAFRAVAGRIPGVPDTARPRIPRSAAARVGRVEHPLVAWAR